MFSPEPSEDHNASGLSRRLYTSPTTSLIRIQAIVVLLASGTLTTVAQIPPTPGAGREGYASVPGARLFYTDTGGAGIPVVLLHAATGNTSAWQYQTRAFTAAGYRIIAYDRRGWGRTVVDSNGPAGTAADDLRGLLDSLDLIACILSRPLAGDSLPLISLCRFRNACGASSWPTPLEACRTRRSSISRPEFARRSSMSCHRMFAS